MQENGDSCECANAIFMPTGNTFNDALFHARMGAILCQGQHGNRK